MRGALAAEFIEYMRKNERKLMSAELSQAKLAYAAREHSTVAQDIGHLATAGASGQTKYGSTDADHTPEAEFIAVGAPMGRPPKRAPLSDPSE